MRHRRLETTARYAQARAEAVASWSSRSSSPKTLSELGSPSVVSTGTTVDPHSMGTGHATWASLSGLRTNRMATA
jgi:hypothetical protein